jgi:hypothetical protein
MSIFMVTKCAAGVANDYVLTFGNNNNAILAGWGANLEIYSTPRLAICPNPTGWTVAAVVRNAAIPSTATWGNGFPGVASGSSQTTSSGGVILGDGTGGGGAPYDGDIAEVLIFPTALSTTDRQNVERSLGAKYGISVA